MKYLALAFALLSGSAAAATITTCLVDDVTIEGVSASSCAGMFSGNVNALEDVNTALGTSYTEYTDLTALSSAYGGLIEVVLKQNTHWAAYHFDLSQIDIGANGLWDLVWSTSGMQWDNKPDVRGCQGCGELSHSALVSYGVSEVPLPGTLSLLGVGLLGLGLVRRRGATQR